MSQVVCGVRSVELQISKRRYVKYAWKVFEDADHRSHLLYEPMQLQGSQLPVLVPGK